MLTLKIVKGKIVGLIPADKYSQEWAEKREGREIVFYPQEKQGSYLRNKYWQFLECCMELPEIVLYDILKGKEFDSEKKQKDYFRKKILVACGYTEPTLVPEGDDLIWRDIPKRTSKMGDEEFMKMYADMRELVFELCKKPRIRKVNGVYETIEGMSDLQMFEIFGCLYLGIQFKEMEQVEKQLENLDLNQTINYLTAIKQLGTFITTEMWENSKTQ